MGTADDFDYSYYKQQRRSPLRRAGKVVRMKRVRSPTRRTLSSLIQPDDSIPPSQIKTAIKRMIAIQSDITVDEILERLNVNIIVSKTTVSGMLSEFRHTLKVLRDAGLLRM